jgi:anti-sigma B factor antagonist
VDVTRNKVGDVTVLIPRVSYLDASNTADFKRQMTTFVERKARVVVDLAQVEFVDSSGCGALISCLRQLRSVEGDLKLCSITRPVRSLFELVRLHRIVDIYNTCDEAVKAFQV